MIYHVTIKSVKGKKGNEYPLKGWNELLDGKVYNPRTRKYTNTVKNTNDNVCIKNIYRDLVTKKVKLKPPIQVHYDIYAQDKKHDRDNLYAVAKSFNDSLQKLKLLSNDGWGEVLDSTFTTRVDKNEPRIEVTIRDSEGD